MHGRGADGRDLRGLLLTGVVMALPQLAQLFQIPAAWTTSRLGARRAAIVLVALQRQVALPLAALPWLPLPASVSRAVLVVVRAARSVLPGRFVRRVFRHPASGDAGPS